MNIFMAFPAKPLENEWILISHVMVGIWFAFLIAFATRIWAFNRSALDGRVDYPMRPFLLRICILPSINPPPMDLGMCRIPFLPSFVHYIGMRLSIFFTCSHCLFMVSVIPCLRAYFGFFPILFKIFPDFFRMELSIQARPFRRGQFHGATSLL